MKTILITGTSGFIAGQFFNYLAREHPEVRVYGFDLANGQDLRDQDMVMSAVEGRDHVFHLGALTHVHQSIATPEPFIDTNVKGMLNILQACRKHKVPLTHISTSEYYGTSQCEPEPQDENHPCAPHSPYGASKVAQDRMCHAWRQTYELDVRIVRLFNQYGPGQDVRKVIPRFMHQMQQHKPLTIHGDGNGSRDYVFIQDTVSGIWQSQKMAAGLVANLGTELTWTSNEVAQLVLDIGEREHDIVSPGVVHVGSYNESRWGHVYCLRGSNKRAFDLMGWEPKTNFADGIHKTWNWFLGHGPVFYRGGETSEMISHEPWADKKSYGQKPD